VADIGWSCFGRINVLDEDTLKREGRQAAVNRRIEELQKLPITQATELTVAQTAELKTFLLERTLTNLLPVHCRLTLGELNGIRLNVARDMLESVFDERKKLKSEAKKKKEEIDIETLNERLHSTMATVLENSEDPQHLLNLSELVKSEENTVAQWRQLVMKAQERVKELRGRNLEKFRQAFEHRVIRQCRENLRKIKKDLSEPKRKRLEELEEPARTKPDDDIMDRYDQISLDISKKLLETVTGQIDTLIKQNAPKQKVATLKDQLELTLQYWVDETDDAEPQIQNPFHLLEISTIVKPYDPSLSIALCAKIRGRIEEIREGNIEHKALQKELDLITEDRTKLFDKWKVPAADADDRFIRLKTEDSLRRCLPSYLRKDEEELEELSQTAARTCLECILELDEKEKKKEITKLLGELFNPKALYQLAEFMRNRTERDNDIIMQIGDRCQTQIYHMEDLGRERRKPTRELKVLKEEEKRMAEKFIRISPEKLNRIETLQKQIAALPRWPAFGDLEDPGQYSQTALDIATTMTNAILDSRVELDERVAHLKKSRDPSTIDKKKIEKEYESLNKRMNGMVQTCLQKFENPIYLCKFAKSMQDRKEKDIVQLVGEKCIQVINNIDELCQQRIPMEKELRELKKDAEELSKIKRELESDKQQRMDKLEAQIAQLPQLPYFAQSKYVQFKDTKLQVVQIMLRVLLEAKSTHEREEASRKFQNGDDMDVDNSDLQAKKKEVEGQLHQLVENVKKNIAEPDHCVEFVNELEIKKVIDELLNYAPTVLKRIRDLEKQMKERDSIKYEIKVLESEKEELKQRKKDIDSTSQERLNKLSEKLNTMTSDFKTSTDYEELTFTLSKALITSVTSAAAEHLPMDKKQKSLKSAIDMLNNPKHLLQVVTLLRTQKEYDSAATAGLRCQKILSDLRTEHALRATHSRVLEELIAEKELLDRKRKVLDQAKLKEIRKLKQEKLEEENLPSYRRTDDYDDQLVQLVQSMVKSCVEAVEHFETAVSEGTAVGDLEIKAAKLRENTKKTLSEGLKSINDVASLLSITKDLAREKRNELAIDSGLYVQKNIEELSKKIQEREEIAALLKKTEEEVLVNSLKENLTAEDKKKVADQAASLKKQLSEWPESLVDKETMDNYLLQVCDVIISCARLEDDLDLVRDQQIIAFKVDASQERWNDIRHLTSDENEWENIKNELVVYAMKRAAGAPVKERIDLLLKDELYDQAIEIFPPPSESLEEVELLERFWLEIEKNKPTKLEMLMPIVSKYIKRAFHQYEFDKMETLLNQVQRQYPGLIVPLYTSATDILLLNILPSQYALLVQGIKGLKKRLTLIGRQNDWLAFLEEFKKKHKGKKRLIQMINLVGDSVWDLKTLLSKAPKKEIKEDIDEFSDNRKRKAVKQAGRAAKKTAHFDEEDE